MGLADLFLDEFQDGRDIVTTSMVTDGTGNDVTPLPSPKEEMGQNGALVPKEGALKRYTGDPVTAAELDILYSGNLVYATDVPAQSLQNDAAADAIAVQSTDAAERRIPAPEIEPTPDPIPSEPQPVLGPINSGPTSTPSKKKRKKKKGKDSKMVQAIEGGAAVIPELPSPPPLAPPMVESDLLEPPLALPESPRPLEEATLLPRAVSPSPPFVHYGISRLPVVTSDHYLASYAWHAPLRPSSITSSGNEDRIPPRSQRR